MVYRDFEPLAPFALRSALDVMGRAGSACGCCYRDVGDSDPGSPEPPISVPDLPDLEAAPASFAGGTAQAGVAAPLPVYSNAQIAAYLETGFWSWFGTTPRKFNMDGTGFGANSGVLLYNVAGLTAAGALLAEEALAIYGEVLGIDFVETASTDSSVDLVFDDDLPGAYAFSQLYAGGRVIDRSEINISTDWLAAYGTGLRSYSFQTYLHEIGHALGLGHAGPYNGYANYVFDTSDPDYGSNSNIYLNDVWQRSIMSYFDQTENLSLDASYALLLGPMAADWLALGNMYGLGEAFAGDTVWGHNSTITTTAYAGLAAQAGAMAFTIVDGSGVDTVDFSGFGMAQRIDLNAGSFSDVGGLRGNMSIADGTVIENARGGSGADLLIGNGVANVLKGNAGADQLFGFGGDDILEGGTGDDAMSGGSGNDIYYVDAAGDVVSEAGGSGYDTVNAFVTHRLASGLERLLLVGKENISGTGNELGNEIVGNTGRNTLRGLDGDDVMRSGAGADIVIAGKGRDVFQFLGPKASNAAERDILRAGDGAVAFERPGNKLGDRFDFSLFDADTTRSGLQDFGFGTQTGTGRLWMLDVGKLTYLRGNTDADKTAEFEIAIEDGSVRASAYTAADFIL